MRVTLCAANLPGFAEQAGVEVIVLTPTQMAEVAPDRKTPEQPAAIAVDLAQLRYRSCVVREWEETLPFPPGCSNATSVKNLSPAPPSLRCTMGASVSDSQVALLLLSAAPSMEDSNEISGHLHTYR